MEEDDDFNYNNPVEVTEIFRTQTLESKETEDKDAEGRPIMTMVPVTTEYGAKIAFTWEDIKLISEYPYPDNWDKYKGPKLSVMLHNRQEEKVIMGKYRELYNRWKAFRNKYSVFRGYE